MYLLTLRVTRARLAHHINDSEMKMLKSELFDVWINLKKAIHASSRIPAIKQGEVWWCAMGENVGIEINGKNQVFSRPVLIFKKLSRFGFVGIPLTSQPHSGCWYVPFNFQGKTSIAVLSQIRTFSVLRLYRRMGTLPESDLRMIKEGFLRLYGN